MDSRPPALNGGGSVNWPNGSTPSNPSSLPSMMHAPHLHHAQPPPGYLNYLSRPMVPQPRYPMMPMSPQTAYLQMQQLQHAQYLQQQQHAMHQAQLQQYRSPFMSPSSPHPFNFPPSIMPPSLSPPSTHQSTNGNMSALPGSQSFFAGALLNSNLPNQTGAISDSSPNGKLTFAQKLVSEILKSGDSTWYTQFIDYHKLEQTIQRIVHLEQNPTETLTFGEESLAAAAHSSPLAEDKIPVPPSVIAAVSKSTSSTESSSSPSPSPTSSSSDSTPPTSATLQTTGASQKLRDIFWMLLGQEISKVESFYLRHESQLAQLLQADLQLERQLFELPDSVEKIRNEHAKYVPVIIQQWAASNESSTDSTAPPSPASSQPSSTPTPGTPEYDNFARKFFPSMTLSPQVSLMFLQKLKEFHPSLWSGIAQNAKTLLPDLLLLIPYVSDPSTLQLIHRFFGGLLQLDRLMRYSALNGVILLKLIKSYDHHTQRRVEKPYLSKILQQPLFSSRVLAKLVAYSTDLILTKLLPMKSTFTPFNRILADRQCPSCHADARQLPLILPCSHRVCFGCVAQRGGGLNCPVEGCAASPNHDSNGTSHSSTDAPLDTIQPADLQIESVLSKLFALAEAAQEESSTPSSTQPRKALKVAPSQSASQQQRLQAHIHTPYQHPPQQPLASLPSFGSVPTSSPQIPPPPAPTNLPHHLASNLPKPASPIPKPTPLLLGVRKRDSPNAHYPAHSPVGSNSFLTASTSMSRGIGTNASLMMMAGVLQAPSSITSSTPQLNSAIGPLPLLPFLSPPPSQSHALSKASCHFCKTMREGRNLIVCTIDPDIRSPIGDRRRKCRKKMCQACMLRLYGLHIDRLTQLERDFFRCPACLNSCICSACKKRDLDAGLIPVPLNPKTGLPLISPYTDSAAYSPLSETKLRMKSSWASQPIPLDLVSSANMTDSSLESRDDHEPAGELPLNPPPLSASNSTSSVSSTSNNASVGSLVVSDQTNPHVAAPVAMADESSDTTNTAASSPPLSPSSSSPSASSPPKVLGEFGCHRDRSVGGGVAPYSPIIPTPPIPHIYQQEVSIQ